MEDANIKDVYVKYFNSNELKEIQPEYVYFTIPLKYINIYHKLLFYISEFGEEILKDCKASCGNKNKTLMNCWNVFQSALTCFNSGREKEADLFIKYIEAELKNNYKEKSSYNGAVTAKLTPTGELIALLTGNETSKFYVDIETGELYQQYLEGIENGKVYTLDETDLISE